MQTGSKSSEALFIKALRRTSSGAHECQRVLHSEKKKRRKTTLPAILPNVGKKRMYVVSMKKTLNS